MGFNYSSLRKLDSLYQETFRRAVHMELATDAQHIGDEMYEAVANAIINQDMARSDKEWAARKKEGLEKLRKVAEVAETPEEQANVREAERATKDMIRIYEQEMLPLIRKGATVPGPISALDALVDNRIATIDVTLAWVAQSMSEKNQRAAGEYNTILRQTRGFGFAVSLAGILAVIVISTRTTRPIVGPLAEITAAALEIKKGNYLIELTHRSDDEIGVLADAFRDMSDKVEERTAELQASNEQLQREIVDRSQAEEESPSEYTARAAGRGADSRAG